MYIKHIVWRQVLEDSIEVYNVPILNRVASISALIALYCSILYWQECVYSQDWSVQEDNI